jgi:hypothetical protein
MSPRRSGSDRGLPRSLSARMTSDLAALNLYTHENLGSPEQSLFKVLNRALNERDRRHIVPFFPHMKLFAKPT